MNAGISAIGPRLAKLLPLLSSDQPGEVVATVRAIGQTLQRGGMDWHDLAAVVSSEAKRQAVPGFTFASLAPHSAKADCPAGRTADSAHAGPRAA